MSVATTTHDETEVAASTETTPPAPPAVPPQAVDININVRVDGSSAAAPSPTPPPTKAEPQAAPETEQEVKALSMNEITRAVENVIEDVASRHIWEAESDDENLLAGWPTAVLVYDGYAVAKVGLRYFKVTYQMVNGTVEVPPVEEWTRVEKEWVEAKFIDNTTIAFGGATKAMGNGVIGGYLVRFTDPDHPDLAGDYFDASTDFGPHNKCIPWYHHGLDGTLGLKRLGTGMADIKTDNVGVWVQAQLNLADEYEAAIYELVKAGRLGWSSGTSSHLVRREPMGKAYHIKTWPLGLDASLTPEPAAGPGLTQVIPLKSYVQDQAAGVPSLKALLQEVEATSTADAGRDADTQSPANQSALEMEEMNPEELAGLIANAVKTAVEPIQAEVNAVKTALANEPAVNDTGHQVPQEPQEDGSAIKQAFFIKTLGDQQASHEAVLKAAIGNNYQDIIWMQNLAFAKFLRLGASRLNGDEMKLLQTQIFTPQRILQMAHIMEMPAIRATMQEAQGTLGGYAVPPNIQSEYLRRLPGLTAVRGGGATIINLTTGNGTTVLEYTGGDDRYVGNMRGQWAAEGARGAEQHATLGQQRLDAHPYTYPVWMTRDLVEDAANLVDIVTEDMITTGALDEDMAFLTGDGTGKPYGLLPGGLNIHGLKEVVSGSASGLTAVGIKKLKRGVASQYRSRGTWVANSDTYGDIEVLKVGDDSTEYAFPDLSDSDMLLARRALESEVMPDVAAGAYPIIFGDMSGYWIVEREGMTIERFHDSYTGANRVMFEVRRRVGGRPTQLYRFAVQKVAAS